MYLISHSILSVSKLVDVVEMNNNSYMINVITIPSLYNEKDKIERRQ